MAEELSPWQTGSRVGRTVGNLPRDASNLFLLLSLPCWRPGGLTHEHMEITEWVREGTGVQKQRTGNELDWTVRGTQ